MAIKGRVLDFHPFSPLFATDGIELSLWRKIRVSAEKRIFLHAEKYFSPRR